MRDKKTGYRILEFLSPLELKPGSTDGIYMLSPTIFLSAHQSQDTKKCAQYL